MFTDWYVVGSMVEQIDEPAGCKADLLVWETETVVTCSRLTAVVGGARFDPSAVKTWKPVKSETLDTKGNWIAPI